ncbi:Maf family protein [Halofilum ochraceum]|uniref:Maf family protein n=1 Tax=Halofilum ochraceum TaxID=1611323 RepID=UPI00082DC1C8|nr:Maf family protein [Halofilum ochraceum]
MPEKREIVDLLLASRSPRRRELLDQVGLTYSVLDPDVDETPESGESPQALVERLARAKARAGRTAAGGLPVLAADTAVVADGVALGKPADAAHALAMLERLSGRSHEVVSGIAVDADGAIASRVVESIVTLRPTTAAERRAYWASGEPDGKAGGYAIQGLGAVFVERLEGSYSNVVGLPLFETLALLRDHGVDPLARYVSC